MADAKMPPILRVVNEWLKAQTPVTAITGTRISYRLGDTYPAIRMTDLGPVQRGTDEQLRRIQIECWAADYATSEDLAAEVERHLPESRGQWASGYCAGGDVTAGPFASPDENSQRFRHQLDVALWIYPTP